jgi:hypothetical protein
MSKTSLCIGAAREADFAAARKDELFWRMGFAKLTSLSYEFLSLDPSNLTTAVLGLVCRACAAGLALRRADPRAQCRKPEFDVAGWDQGPR